MTDWETSLDRTMKMANKVADESIAAHNRVARRGGVATLQQYGITLSVGAGGRVLGLSLGNEAMKLPEHKLSAAILECARKAELDYAKAMEGAAEETLGDSDVGRKVVREMHEKYPGLAGELEEQVFIVEGIEIDEDDDEGWNQPILRS